VGSNLGGCWVREEQKGRKFGSEARDRLLSLSVFFDRLLSLSVFFYRLLSWIVYVLLFAFTGFFLEKAGRR